jgi:hypothetical protein
MQEQLQAWLTPLAPYGLVVLLGAIVGLAEISSTFPSYPREALRTRWARLLILVNMGAAALAFWVARIMAPDANLALLVVGVGIGFQALIRTRFTLAKQIGGTDGNIEINLGWLYDQFQHLCKTQIDLELMKGRRTAVTQLFTRYPTLRDLHSTATYTLLARATLTEEERKARRTALDAMLDPKVPDDVARTGLALSILENGGTEYVELLLGQPSEEALPVASPENLVKQLVEKYNLGDLVELAKKIITVPEVVAWIEQSATENAPEADRKAAIAHKLVEHAGVEVVQKELAERS